MQLSVCQSLLIVFVCVCVRVKTITTDLYFCQTVNTFAFQQDKKLERTTKEHRSGFGKSL